MKSKKGQIFDQLGALGVGIAGLVIVLVVTFLILSNSRTTMTSNGQDCAGVGANGANASMYVQNATGLANGGCCKVGMLSCTGDNLSGYSNAYNSTNTLANAVGTIPGWVPLIVIAVVGAILLGLVAMFRNK